MLTVLKTEIGHCCDNCRPGHWDVNNEEFATFLTAQETLRAAIVVALALGFEVINMKPDLVELERTDEDVHDRLKMRLMADEIGAN